MLLCSFTKKKTSRTWQCFSRLLARHFQNALIACCYVSRAQLVQMSRDRDNRDTFDFSQGHVTKNQPMAVPV